MRCYYCGGKVSGKENCPHCGANPDGPDVSEDTQQVAEGFYDAWRAPDAGALPVIAGVPVAHPELARADAASRSMRESFEEFKRQSAKAREKLDALKRDRRKFIAGRRLDITTISCTLILGVMTASMAGLHPVYAVIATADLCIVTWRIVARIRLERAWRNR